MEREYPYRAELRCHSVNSAMKGVATTYELLSSVGESGASAVAITDTDSVNAYADIDSYHRRGKNMPKTIMGVETYIEGDQVTILVTSDVGRKNLYRILSMRNMDEHHNLTWEAVNNHREGILIGSGALEGKLYKLLKSEMELDDDFAGLYDYIEVLPASALVEEEKTLSEWQEKTIELISYAERNSKKAVAVSDAYTYIKTDEFVEKVLLNSQGRPDEAFGKYLSTEEMMKEFGFIGESEAYRLVVVNSNLIANECDSVMATVDAKQYPDIEQMDNRLKELCFDKAYEIYGEDFDENIKSRLEWELDAIKRTGVAFEILLTAELMKKNQLTANDVSLRGSAGASLVVYLCGISSYNPLAFGLVPYFAYGYDGNRELDIDLNVPSLLHEDILNSCADLEGIDMTLRAGTLCYMPDTVVKYAIEKYEEQYKKLDHAERIFLREKLRNVVTKERGMHPGGMILIPSGKDISDATPIRKLKGIAISDKDYHSFDDVFYKQDILPHSDDQLLYNLQRRTGVNLDNINLEDEDILSLFNSPECLGIESKQIDGYRTGLLGLPECSSPWVQQMLLTAPVCSFEDMVRIAALSHGTDTWIDNAEVLISDGIAKLDEVVSSRESVYDYLIEKGLDAERAYNIAERVRKGRGVSEEDTLVMQEHDIPTWYIDSCNKVRYLFPRAHCISYIIKLWKLAYFKIHYPRSFYEEHFRVKEYVGLQKAISEGYKAFCKYAEEMMCGYADHEMTANEYNEILLAKEMYARGAEYVSE